MFTWVSASEGTTTDDPQSIHLLSDANSTLKWQTLTWSGELYYGWWIWCHFL